MQYINWWKQSLSMIGNNFQHCHASSTWGWQLGVCTFIFGFICPCFVLSYMLIFWLLYHCFFCPFFYKQSFNFLLVVLLFVFCCFLYAVLNLVLYVLLLFFCVFDCLFLKNSIWILCLIWHWIFCNVCVFDLLIFCQKL